jgi:hypothetical protein
LTIICCPNCWGSGGGQGFYSCSWCHGTGEYDGRDHRGRHITYEGARRQADRSYYQIRTRPSLLIKAWQSLAAWFAREVPI